MESNLSKQPAKSKTKSTSTATESLESRKPGRSRTGESAMSAHASSMSVKGGSTAAERAGDTTDGNGKSRKGVLSKASGIAHNAADTVMHAATEQAQSLTHHVTGMLDEQVAHGADIASQVARTTRRAAEELEETSPRAAEVVRTVAEKIDNYAGTMRNQSAEQLFETASDFTRRQPALVFGLAALAGFVAFRTFKAAPPLSYRGQSYQGQQRYQGQRYTGLEGNA